MTRLRADGASGGLSWWSAGMILAGEITHYLLVMRCSVGAEKLLWANEILMVTVSLMLILMTRLMLTLMVPQGGDEVDEIAHQCWDAAESCHEKFLSIELNEKAFKPSQKPALVCLQCSQVQNNVNIVQVASMDTVQIMTSRSGSKITHHCIESIEAVQRWALKVIVNHSTIDFSSAAFDIW